MTISYSFVACCLFGVVFLQSKAGDCVESQLTNLSLIKQPRTDSPSKRQILLGQVSFLSLPLVIGIVMCFFVGNVFESFWLRAIWRELRKLDDYVLHGEREHFVICCGSKNSSKLLFSRFQLIDSCHGDSCIKGRDFTEVIILSWHRCLSFVCQCFFRFSRFLSL